MRVLIRTPEPRCANDIADVLRVFLGALEYTLEAGDGADHILTVTETRREERVYCHARISGGLSGEGENAYSPAPDALVEKRLHQRALKLAVYSAMKAATGIRPPWGALTGIRPTRLFYAELRQRKTMEEAERDIQALFDLREDKAALLREIVGIQRLFPDPADDEVGLYVGIPFCATRCSSCSFLSGEIGSGKLVEPYVDALLTEIEAAERLIREAGLRVTSVYMGGGTPTALPEGELRRVLERLAPLSAGQEFTVEAGRPDTITEGKLKAIREAGAKRISVNPQTAHDETLRRIGRAHTTAQTEEAYRMARDMGFEDVNMDLLAGLPGENEDMFRETLDWLRGLYPDSVTVHTLSIKHSSLLHLWQESLPDGDMVGRMLDLGRETAHRMGMRAYYLYRQKYMAGNLENTAYAQPGCECLYNIRMMEETGHVLALGAGGISKRVWPDGGRIRRAPNVGNIEEYIARVDEMVERKRALWLDQG